MTENITTQDSIRALLAPTYSVENSLADNYRALQAEALAHVQEIARLKAQVDDVLNQRDEFVQKTGYATERRNQAVAELAAFKQQVAEALVTYEDETSNSMDDLFEVLGLDRPTKEVEVLITVQVTARLTIPSNVDVSDILDDFEVDSDGQVIYNGEYDVELSADLQTIQEN